MNPKSFSPCGCVVGACLLLVATQAVQGDFVPPKFCRGLNCPEFKVLKDVGRDGELRKYAPSTWVYTDSRQKFFEKATAEGFSRLFKYLVGYNELQEQIEMTSPVVTSVFLDENNHFKHDFTVSFFLPLEYQKDQGDDQYAEPPLPKDERVHLIHYDEAEFYVLPFSFYALGIRVKSLALGFFDYLERNGHDDIDRSMFLVAQYDPPFKPFDRHNEIWVLRTKEEKHHKKKHDDKGHRHDPLWPPYDIDTHEDDATSGIQGRQHTPAQNKNVRLLQVHSRRSPKAQHVMAT